MMDHSPEQQLQSLLNLNLQLPDCALCYWPGAVEVN